MAAQFCDLAAAARMLGVSEDEVKGMVREGRLREYHDAGKVRYRVDEVNRLAAKDGSSIVNLAVGEDSADLGLSGSDVIALEGSGEVRPGKGDTKISNVGISVFDDEELEIDVDPLAKTHITPAMEDKVALGGSGSGSGLLDLTRESDDTSLGAELLDVISPTEGAGETATAEAPAIGETITTPVAPAMDDFGMDMSAPVVSRAPVGDPQGPIFTGLLVASVILLSLVGLVSASALGGVWPSFLEQIASKALIFVVGGGAALAIIGAVVGMLVGKSSAAPARRVMR